MITDLQTLLNCTPPWLVKDSNQWCDGQLEIGQEIRSRLRILTDKIIDFAYASTNCPNPCKSITFESKYEYMENMEDTFGVYIRFLDVVEVTRSDLLLKPLTMVGRLGGIIGVGKEVLWISIFFLGSAVSVISVTQSTIRRFFKN